MEWNYHATLFQLINKAQCFGVMAALRHATCGQGRRECRRSSRPSLRGRLARQRCGCHPLRGTFFLSLLQAKPLGGREGRIMNGDQARAVDLATFANADRGGHSSGNPSPAGGNAGGPERISCGGSEGSGAAHPLHPEQVSRHAGSEASTGMALWCCLSQRV